MPDRSRLVPLIVVMLSLAPALAALVWVPASATPIVVDRFSDGSTGARLNFSLNAWNDSLALELPRGARIKSAELIVAGIEGGSVIDTPWDFHKNTIGDDLWALRNRTCNVYPPEVDPYESGWPGFSALGKVYIAVEDDLWTYSMTEAINSTPPFYYPYQLFHFHPEDIPAFSYTVTWNGYGVCTANLTAVYQAEMWLYDHTSSSWERKASYASDDSDDFWLETTFASTDDFLSANGSVDVILAGPHSIDIPTGSANGAVYTDYIGLGLGLSGDMEYPQNATLRLGGVRFNLSAGPFKGQLKLDDALGFKDALQAAVDAEFVMPGTIAIPINISVERRTLSAIDVGSLRVEYEPIVNAPPVWRGPATVEVRLGGKKWRFAGVAADRHVRLVLDEEHRVRP